MPTDVFGYTGSVQTWTVPAGVTSVLVDAVGARGGHGRAPANNARRPINDGGSGGPISLTAGTAATVQLPLGRVDGDLMLLVVGCVNASTSPAISVSAGWTLVDHVTCQNTTAPIGRAHLWVYARSNLAAHTSPSVTLPIGSTDGHAYIGSLRNADGSTFPMPSGVVSGSRDQVGSPTVWNPPMPSAGSGPQQLIAFTIGMGNQAPITWPGTDTEQWGSWNNNCGHRSAIPTSFTGSPPAPTLGIPSSFGQATIMWCAPFVGAARPLGGNGGRVRCRIPVSAGETLLIYVGGRGLDSSRLTTRPRVSNGSVDTGSGGAVEWQYVGWGGLSNFGGSGGAASEVRRGASASAVAGHTRLVVGPGGGGAGTWGPDQAGATDGGAGGSPGTSATDTTYHSTATGAGSGGPGAVGATPGAGGAYPDGGVGGPGSGSTGGKSYGEGGQGTGQFVGQQASGFGGGGGGGGYAGGGGGAYTGNWVSTQGTGGGAGGGGGSGLSSGVDELLQTGVGTSDGTVTLTWGPSASPTGGFHAGLPMGSTAVHGLHLSG